MRYEVNLKGNPPGFLMHNIDGGFVPSPAKAEMEKLHAMSPKAKKEAANMARVRDLEWELGFYRDNERPIIPAKVLRATVHAAAKLTRDGQAVNRGLQIVGGSINFEYPPDTGKTIKQLKDNPAYRHEAAARVNKAMVLRVRPLMPVWGVRFAIEADPELISPDNLRNWIEQAGRFIGIGDWRPDKGGEFGTFEVVGFDEA